MTGFLSFGFSFSIVFMPTKKPQHFNINLLQHLEMSEGPNDWFHMTAKVYLKYRNNISDAINYAQQF